MATGQPLAYIHRDDQDPLSAARDRALQGALSSSDRAAAAALEPAQPRPPVPRTLLSSSTPIAGAAFAAPPPAAAAAPPPAAAATPLAPAPDDEPPAKHWIRFKCHGCSKKLKAEVRPIAACCAHRTHFGGVRREC